MKDDLKRLYFSPKLQNMFKFFLYKANPGVSAGDYGTGRVYTPGSQDPHGNYQYEGQNQQRTNEPEVQFKDVHSAAAEQYEINKDASDIGKNFGDQGHTSYKKSYVGSQMKDGIEEADVESWDPNKM